MAVLFSDASRRGFLRRKFAPPQLPPSYIPERHLTDQILDISSWRVCLMSVAAGYGKTSLLRQWYDELKGAACEVVWVMLDAGDARADRFLGSVCHALSGVNPSFDSL